MEDQQIQPESPDIQKGFFEKAISKINLKVAVVLIIIVSLLLVLFSYWAYTSSDRYKYDLARPDVEREVKVDIDESALDKTSPVEANTVKDLQKLLSEQNKSLDGLNDFSARALSDEALQVNTAD